jgi:hypothetical protein
LQFRWPVDRERAGSLFLPLLVHGSHRRFPAIILQTFAAAPDMLARGTTKNRLKISYMRTRAVPGAN